MIHLANPWFLLLLFLAIPLFYRGSRAGGRIRFSNIDLLKRLSQPKFHPRQILLGLRVLAFTLLVIALARPQMGKRFTEVESEGVDIILALDTSGSMQALDFKVEGKRVNRLEIVKKVVADFIDKRPNDRMGLVVFGEEAFTQCPLTLDHGILVEFLKQTQIGMAGDGTAIGSAIGTSINRLKDLKSKSKIVILLTDGVSNAGELSPLDAARLAQSFNTKVYTIGVGSNGAAPYEVEGFFGKQLMMQEVEMDEATLQKIAETTKARYFQATKTEELQQIYDEIDRLEKYKIKVKEYTEYKEIFIYFVLMALGLLLIEMVLSQTRLRKLP